MNKDSALNKEAKKVSLRFKIKQAENQILNQKEVCEGNISYMKYIESLKLMVEVDGKMVPVNRNTVCLYEENQELIKARIDDLESKVKSYRQELKELENNESN